MSYAHVCSYYIRILRQSCYSPLVLFFLNSDRYDYFVINRLLEKENNFRYIIYLSSRLSIIVDYKEAKFTSNSNELSNIQACYMHHVGNLHYESDTLL